MQKNESLNDNRNCSLALHVLVVSHRGLKSIKIPLNGLNDDINDLIIEDRFWNLRSVVFG